MEQTDATRKARKRAIQAQGGRTFHSLGVLAYTPQQESKLLETPAYTGYRKPLQSPLTGEPYFMLGYDPLV